MSLLVFPPFNPPEWNYTFPLKQTPSFKTITQTAASGRGELRVPLMFFPRWDITLDLSYIKGDASQTNSAWQQLVNFFIAVQGAATDWMFDHPLDNSVTNQAIATTDGTTTEFTMYRSLVTGGAQDLIQNFQAAPVIMLDGSVQSSSLYSIDQYGTLTFTTPPASGHTLSWTGSFYYRCHFLTDSWDNMELQLTSIWQNSEVKFRSCLL